MNITLEGKCALVTGGNSGIGAAIAPALAEAGAKVAINYRAFRSSGRTHKAVNARAGIVTMKTCVGGMRIVEMMPGEQLPRIC